MASAGTTQFHLQQLQSLRGEIDEKLKELRANERYVLLGIAAVWAFMLQTVHAADRAMTQWTVWADAVAWWFPVLLTGFGWWRSRLTVTAMSDIAGYIRLAEKTAYTHRALPGWESWREANFMDSRNVGTTAEAFWIVLLVITVAVASLAMYHTVQQAAR